jgi:hypothetical protein
VLRNPGGVQCRTNPGFDICRVNWVHHGMYMLKKKYGQVISLCIHLRPARWP